MSDPDKRTAVGQASLLAEHPVRSRTATYAGVIAVEIAVIVALWLFGRYFSA